MTTEKCCRKCGNVTYYSRKNRYECQKREVSPDGVCDRFQKSCSTEEMMRRLEKAIKRIEKYDDGTYVVNTLPPYGQNYREQGQATLE